jgi:hypothetical protein
MLDHFALKLRTVKGYRRQFLNMFGTEVNPQGIAKAIVGFARMLVSTNSAFDQYSLGNKQAMNQATIRGMTLFKAEIERVLRGNFRKTVSDTPVQLSPDDPPLVPTLRFSLSHGLYAFPHDAQNGIPARPQGDRRPKRTLGVRCRETGD